MNETLQKYKDFIKSIEEGEVDFGKMTDEEIDEVIKDQNDVLEILKGSIAKKSIYRERRLKAEKQEEREEKLVKSCMRVLKLDDFESEDGSVCKVVTYVYDTKAIDVAKLPSNLLMPNHAGIRAKLAKGEYVEGVNATGYETFKIK